MSGESCETQWKNIEDIFKQIEKNENGGLTFKCLLCIPKTKTIKASVTSASNLRAHLKVSKKVIYSLFFSKIILTFLLNLTDGGS